MEVELDDDPARPVEPEDHEARGAPILRLAFVAAVAIGEPTEDHAGDPTGEVPRHAPGGRSAEPHHPKDANAAGGHLEGGDEEGAARVVVLHRGARVSLACAVTP